MTARKKKEQMTKKAVITTITNTSKHTPTIASRLRACDDTS